MVHTTYFPPGPRDTELTLVSVTSSPFFPEKIEVKRDRPRDRITREMIEIVAAFIISVTVDESFEDIPSNCVENVGNTFRIILFERLNEPLNPANNNNNSNNN